MELVVIILCSMSGALIGTAIGILLMFRKVRQPLTGGELELLRSGAEAALAARTADLENLRKRMMEQDQAIQRSEETLKAKQQQLEIAVAESATTGRMLEAKLKEEKDLRAEMVDQQVASYEAQLDNDRRQVQELTEQVARLTAEAGDVKRSYEEEQLHRSSLEEQLGGGLKRIHELTAQIQELTAQIQELESERSQFDRKLQDERQSAAKGMELLLMAQENLARVFNPPAADGRNGSNGHGSLEAAVAVRGEGASDS